MGKVIKDEVETVLFRDIKTPTTVEGFRENLRKYYWQENKRHIENKDGIVFSDEYHAKDSGDPQYYLELIMDASKKVGLDLRAKGAGLTDGKYNTKTQ